MEEENIKYIDSLDYLPGYLAKFKDKDTIFDELKRMVRIHRQATVEYVYLAKLYGWHEAEKHKKLSILNDEYLSRAIEIDRAFKAPSVKYHKKADDGYFFYTSNRPFRYTNLEREGAITRKKMKKMKERAELAFYICRWLHCDLNKL